MKRFSILSVLLLSFVFIFAGEVQLSRYLSQNFGLSSSFGILANYDLVEGSSVNLPKPKNQPRDIEIKYPKGKKRVEVELVLNSGITFKTENVTVKALGTNKYLFELAESSEPSYLVILSGKDVLFAIGAVRTSTGKVMVSYWYRK